MKLLMRSILAGALAFVPLSLIDVVRRRHHATVRGSAAERALFALLNVLRHRRFDPSIPALYIEPLALHFANDNSVLTKRLYFLGDYEAGEWRWWDHWCHRSRCVLELGANTGFYTVLGGRVPGVNQYVAVEPHPYTARVLRQNLALNGVTRVRVVEAAAVGAPDRERMELRVPRLDRDTTPTGAFISTSADGEGGSRESILVDIVDARALVEGADLIKMDIEGQELSVLRSVEDILEACKPTIFLELRRGNVELREYLPDLCRRCGYTVLAIEERGLRPIDVDDAPKLDYQRRFGTRDVILTAASPDAWSAGPQSAGGPRVT
jgi:FkbM family methyltransferase